MRLMYKPKADKIRIAFLEKGYSSIEFSNLSGLAYLTIINILKGKPVQVKTAYKLSKALNVPVTELFE